LPRDHAQGQPLPLGERDIDASEGYDAFATDDYSGPSASLGIELAGFE
jgi:hypothetical protein